jgi:pimeloyl-ACP methyl ester carboxylesterase
VHGAESDVVSAAQSRRLAGLLPRGRWAQVPDASHSVQGDNPKGLVELLAPFLAECFGRAG